MTAIPPGWEPVPFGRPAGHTGGSYEWYYWTFGPGSKVAPAPGLRPRRYDSGVGTTTIDSVPDNLGTIQTKSGWTYDLTPGDLLWLARAVEAEGGTRPDATIWTFAQDFALHHGDSFTSLIRSYSQPVNPIWSSPTASGCVAHPDMCSAAKLAHRADVQSKPWSSIAAGVRTKVVAFAQAALPNPVPRAVEFAADAVAKAYVSRNPGSRIIMSARGNDYIVTQATADWAADQVTVTFQGRVSKVTSPTLAIVIGVGVVTAAGGFAYWAWRRHRRRVK